MSAVVRPKISAAASVRFAPVRGRGTEISEAAYFNCDEIELKAVLSFVPMPFTTVIMAMEIPAAISPYSMAVATFQEGFERPDHASIIGWRL